jgi:hypothetical protein
MNEHCCDDPHDPFQNSYKSSSWKKRSIKREGRWSLKEIEFSLVS